MEIHNDPKLNAYSGLDRKTQNQKSSAAKGNTRRGDRLDLSGQIPKKDDSDSSVRQDEIARVKANIQAGRYEDPEVIGKIVDRIINQFGL